MNENETKGAAWAEGFAAGRFDASVAATNAVEHMDEVFYTSEWGPVVRRSSVLREMRAAFDIDPKEARS